MSGEIIRFVPPTRIVGENLTCPYCGGRQSFTNVVAQSFAFCRAHGVYWLWGQNVNDRWLGQSPAQWRVNQNYLDKWTRVHVDAPQDRPSHSDGDAA